MDTTPSLFMLFELFQAIAHHGWTTPAHHIRRLQLIDVPPLRIPKLFETTAFERVAKHVESLEVLFASWDTFNRRSQPGLVDIPVNGDVHDFLASLDICFLTKFSEVKKLSLSFKPYVGFSPRVYLDDVRPACLRELELLDFILFPELIRSIAAYGDTLKSLQLVNCTIATETYTRWYSDDDGYPLWGRRLSYPRTFTSPLRWSQVADRFHEDLPELRHFVLRYKDDGDGLKEEYKGKLPLGRYVRYWTGWISPDRIIDGEHDLRRDAAAFVHLHRKIGQCGEASLLEAAYRTKPGFDSYMKEKDGGNGVDSAEARPD